jgi:hypothetical protein
MAMFMGVPENAFECGLCIKGNEKDIKALTIELAWFHASVGYVENVSFLSDGDVVLTFVCDTRQE